MHFGLASPRSAICPGEPVGLHVLLDVVDPGDDGPPRRLVPHRVDLDDAIFDLRQLHVSSPNGTFDADGVFHPSADVLATAQSGFVIFARPPSGPAFSVRYPPSYECRRAIGGAGRAGIAGNAGDHALYGDLPEPNSKEPLPSRAAPGRTGGAGGAGGDGPRMTVYVTWVRTPDYTKLLAARATGDVDTLTLSAPGTPLDVVARGGDGGAGGRGGDGAPGVDDFEPGGPGGTGGRGGQGGRGGDVEVVLDERFDELDRHVVIDVRGGEGGEGGAGGSGGRSYVGQSANRRGVGFAERDGVLVAPGPYGAKGTAGEDGNARITRSDVSARFKGLGPVVPL
ncbi:MAG: hypothetical protein KIT84_02355 [Labilithrix sp.]|nr:hypothetical protein [Labilithrix sp.]